MKNQIILLFMLIFIGGYMDLTAQTESNKILVAYFSWSGNAKVLAEQIAQEINGDLFEIKALEPYPDIYDECTRVARQELDNNARPDITGSVDTMSQYDIVFLCFPNWWGTMPMPVWTFLDAYDFSGKTIFPLITHGGGGLGRSINDIQNLSPDATIGESLSISAFSRNPNSTPRVNIPNDAVKSWLRRIGM